jgi:hypothetical protein
VRSTVRTASPTVGPAAPEHVLGKPAEQLVGGHPDQLGHGRVDADVAGVEVVVAHADRRRGEHGVEQRARRAPLADRRGRALGGAPLGGHLEDDGAHPGGPVAVGHGVVVRKPRARHAGPRGRLAGQLDVDHRLVRAQHAAQQRGDLLAERARPTISCGVRPDVLGPREPLIAPARR